MADPQFASCSTTDGHVFDPSPWTSHSFARRVSAMQMFDLWALALSKILPGEGSQVNDDQARGHYRFFVSVD